MIIQKSICDIHFEDEGAMVDAPVTRTFSIDRQSYEAELCPECDERLQAILAPFTEAARRIGAPKKQRKPRQPKIEVVPEEAPGFACNCGRSFPTERGLQRHIARPPAADAEGHEVAA